MQVTLLEEIRSLYDTKMKSYFKKEEYELLVAFFENYCKGKLLQSSIEEILNNNEKFIADIVEGVKSYEKDKCNISKYLEKLLFSLNIKYNLKYEDNLFENFKVKYKNERMLMILKYLHCREKSRSEISKDFGISERSISDYLVELQKGITFLDTNMKINKLEEGTSKYCSLNHPIFLSLNLEEIYLLKKGLEFLSKDSDNKEIYDKISNLIYEQLSDATKQLINLKKLWKFRAF